MSFHLTPRQIEANTLLGGDAKHILLRGGSRSGKTLLFVRAVVARALKAPRSRHALLRFRFNAAKESLALDTYPRVMQLCWPEVRAPMNRTDWYATLPNGSEVWIGGLDDKERTEKILGKEYATILLNECSQIPYASRNLAVTRLAQKVLVEMKGKPTYELPLKMYYDENPTTMAYWTHRLFYMKVDPETREPLPDQLDYAAFKINPEDNAENLPDGYIETLKGLSARLRRRFLHGEYADANPSALFGQEHLDRWRHATGELPDMQRIVVAVDPSGSGDLDNADNDAIGICVCALGVDGNGYLLEDLTVKAGPATWGQIATSAYERHRADLIVAEVNFGGAMVEAVIRAARPRTPYRAVTASRGKVVRAEPIALLTESGKVRLAGYFPALEDELAGFTTNGYVGTGSPNRADAMVWGFSELFHGIVREHLQPPRVQRHERTHANAWMGA